MKSLFFTIALISLSCLAAEQPLQTLTVRNNSNQEVIIFYQTPSLLQCVTIKALGAESIKLFLPQKITAFFRQSNVEREMNIINNTEPVVIKQFDTINISQNGAPLIPAICFNRDNPSLILYQKNAID